MQVPANAEGRNSPKNLVSRLAARLRHHALWDSVLFIAPPGLACIYAVSFLYRASIVGEKAFVLAAAGAVGLGWLAVALRLGPRRANIMSTARLADEKSGAKDHFLTLSTIDPEHCAPSFVVRLRNETDDFRRRIELKRDFPYKLKRSSLVSLLLSLLLAAAIHLVAPLTVPMMRAAIPVPEQLRELAKKLAAQPGLKGLAQELEALAAKLEDPKVPEQEKQASVQEMEKKIEEQQKNEEQKENRDLLSQAANSLEGAEKLQSASGKNQQMDQQQGAGGIQSNLPQDGEGESKQSQGGSGDSKQERNTQLSQDMQQGQSSQGNPKEAGQEKNQQNHGDGKNNQPDPNQPGKEQNKEKTDKNQGGLKEGAGRNQASEEPPQGKPPADRFYKAGEGKDGIKGARYVTVQLPEEVAADSKGETMATKESKGNRVGAKVPVSNVPLPAHVPNAPSEKQHLPIEYRGIIR
jgi:hypothetical protein